MNAHQLVTDMVEKGESSIGKQELMNVLVELNSFLQNIKQGSYFSFGKAYEKAMNNRENVKKNLTFLMTQKINQMLNLTIAQSSNLRAILDRVVVVGEHKVGQTYDQRFDAATLLLDASLEVPHVNIKFILLKRFGELEILVDKITFVHEDTAYLRNTLETIIPNLEGLHKGVSDRRFQKFYLEDNLKTIVETVLKKDIKAIAEYNGNTRGNALADALKPMLKQIYRKNSTAMVSSKRESLGDKKGVIAHFQYGESAVVFSLISYCETHKGEYGVYVSYNTDLKAIERQFEQA